MSAPTESQSAATPDAATAAPSTGTSQRQFLAHINEYPIVNTTKDYVLGKPYTQKAVKALGPKLESVREKQPIKAVFDKGDFIADNALSHVDKFVPGLKTLEFHDITTPVTRPVSGVIEEVHKTATNINDSVHKTILEPSARTVGDLKEKVHSVLYDANGKAIVISHSDPLIAPLNENLERLVTNYFPHLKKVPKESAASELSRTVKIVSYVLCGTRESESEQEAEQQPENATADKTAENAEKK